jgi:hypothetical protein
MKLLIKVPIFPLVSCSQITSINVFVFSFDVRENKVPMHEAALCQLFAIYFSGLGFSMTDTSEYTIVERLITCVWFTTAREMEQVLKT